jgi:hypothetical protein
VLQNIFIMFALENSKQMKVTFSFSWVLPCFHRFTFSFIGFVFALECFFLNCFFSISFQESPMINYLGFNACNVAHV